MPDGSRNDIAEMQRDAERRLREMQKRADMAVKGGQPHRRVPVAPPNAEDNIAKRQAVSEKGDSTVALDRKEPHSKGILGKLKGFELLKLFNFKNIAIDSDVLLIIVLIFLLSNEDTDELLLMALVYIML